MNLIKEFEEELNILKNDKIYRELPQYDESFLDFSSNDYLNLSNDKRVITAGYEAAKTYGAGSSGSRLLSGNKVIFEEFERQIAEDKNMEAALIFNSGFQANLGVLSALLNKNSIAIFDKLNHASMYQGVFLSGAQLLRYNHLDYNKLENLLIENSGKRILIASETVFGMDGDIADLKALSFLSEKYNAILYLDEAHATGLYGKFGYGVSTDFKLDSEKTVVMGTFSKAIGSSGAYVASSQVIIDYLIQKSKSFIYSTALSPFCIGAARFSWELVKTLWDKRKNIIDKSNVLRDNINKAGYKTAGSNTNIIPILFENIQGAEDIKKKLLDHKIIASLIRRPTSPTPRIRIAINAGHKAEDIDSLFNILRDF